MNAKRFVLTILGAELFPLFRVSLGRGMALLILAALTVKHALYQYLPVPEPWAVILHSAVLLSALHVLLGLFGMARIRALMVPRWDTGRKWLSFGSRSDKTTLLKVEPVAAFLLVAIAVLSVTSGEWGGAASTGDAFDAFGKTPVATATRGNVFYPFWHTLGMVETDALGRAVTVYGRRVPQWFHETALMWGMLLPFMAWLGFAMHGKWCDWPESGEYRKEKRQADAAASPGTLTFTTVEEVR